MNNMKRTITEAIQVIDQTTELFYQQKDQEGYQHLDYTIEVLMKTLDQMINSKEEHDILMGIDESNINAILTEAMKALEQKDNILLSDILNYELKEVFQEYLTKM